MRRRISICVGTLVLIAISMAALAQNPPQGARDLTGVWNLAGGTDLSLSRTPPPLTPAGQKRFDANKPSYGRESGSADAAAHPEEHISRRRGVPPALGNDPIGDCNPLGWPRLFYFGRPVEIVQLPDRIVQFWEWTHVWRTIWTDGRQLPKDPDPTWYGYSVGRWDGDTLVVETIGVDDRTWVDHFGNVHSDEMHLTERWRRLDKDNMEVTMVLDDPKFYTQPWVSEKKMWRLQPKRELREEFCAPIDEQSFNQRTRNPAAGLGNSK